MVRWVLFFVVYISMSDNGGFKWFLVFLGWFLVEGLSRVYWSFVLLRVFLVFDYVVYFECWIKYSLEDVIEVSE